MDYKNGVNKSILLRAEITEEQRRRAKQLAKKRRMTFSGFVGSLVERELDKAKDEEANHDSTN